jgi:methionine-rich copper-binding protein CopC
MRILILRSLLAFALLGGVLSPSAWAHARLLRSEPAKDAELASAPDHVNLWFSELLEDGGFNVVTVYAASELGAAKKHDLTADKPHVDPKDRTRLTVKVTALPPGDYIVEWRVLSSDGHSAPGRINFRVRAR